MNRALLIRNAGVVKVVKFETGADQMFLNVKPVDYYGFTSSKMVLTCNLST